MSCTKPCHMFSIERIFLKYAEIWVKMSWKMVKWVKKSALTLGIFDGKTAGAIGSRVAGEAAWRGPGVIFLFLFFFSELGKVVKIAVEIISSLWLILICIFREVDYLGFVCYISISSVCKVYILAMYFTLSFYSKFQN